MVCWFLADNMPRQDTQTKSSFHRVYKGVLDLVLVRFKLFSIEAIEIKEALILKMLLLFSASVFMLLGFTTLLLALNTVLSETAKVWVFFSLCTFFFICSTILVWRVMILTKEQEHPFASTIEELKKDLQVLQGKEDEP